MTILEDMHQGEVDQLVEGLRVVNIDFNQSSDSTLEWVIEKQPKVRLPFSNLIIPREMRNLKLPPFNISL